MLSADYFLVNAYASLKWNAYLGRQSDIQGLLNARAEHKPCKRAHAGHALRTQFKAKCRCIWLAGVLWAHKHLSGRYVHHQSLYKFWRLDKKRDARQRESVVCVCVVTLKRKGMITLGFLRSNRSSSDAA